MERDLTPQVLNDWLGGRLLVRYMTGPDVDVEDLDKTVTGQPEARTELLFLDQIGAYGIVVKKEVEGNPEFIPWGAVLAIQSVGPVEPDDGAL